VTTTNTTTRRQFLLPDVGEGLTEGEVLRWLVAEGDDVVVNQPLVEIETAKAAVELPSPFAGQVAQLHADVGAVLAVGAPLLSIDVVDLEGDSAPVAEPPTLVATAETASATDLKTSGSGPVLVGYGVVASSTRRRPRLASPPPHGTAAPEAGPPGESAKPVRHGGLEVGRATEARFAEPDPLGTGRARAKPPVRKLAKELGINLAAVTPTGPHGTVSRKDVESAARGVSGDRREPVRGVTRLMADAMSASAFTVPHVTEWLDVDVTRSAELLQRFRDAGAFGEVRVTPMLLVARAVLSALRNTPVVNGWFDAPAGEIVHRSDVNLGFAAATPRGLIVPNVKAANRLSVRELAEALAALTATAKQGTASPGDLTGGTFTITNVGVLGVDGGTPIINPGESAILAVGAWRDRPWAYRSEIVVRTVCTLALSFDHRFIDGATAARFLVDVAARLEEPGLSLAD